MRTLIQSYKKQLSFIFSIITIMFITSLVANFLGVYKHNNHNRFYSGVKYSLD